MDILLIGFYIYLVVLSICVAYAIIGINKQTSKLNQFLRYGMFIYPEEELTNVEEDVVECLYENAPKSLTAKDIAGKLAWVYDEKLVINALSGLVAKGSIKKIGNKYRLYHK